MRIIAGTAGGRRLKTIKGLHFRPTTDRVKESLFSALGEKVLEADVLDLFAGTGSLGIEALSRGARTALFIDTSPRAVEIIRENLRLTQFLEHAESWVSDWSSAIRRLGARGRKFDLIFADPPYGRGYGMKTLRTLDTSNLLTPLGIFILEHPSGEDFLCPGCSLEPMWEKTFGGTGIHMYQSLQSKE